MKNSFITLLSSFLILSLATILISQNHNNNLSGKYEPIKEGSFLGKIVSVPPEIQKNNKAVLAEYSGSGNKHIYVDLNKQTLYAYEDDRLIYTFLISSGKWYPTPTGDFNIWIKVKYQKMSGGNPALHTQYENCRCRNSLLLDQSKSTGKHHPCK